jgi:ribosomal protein S18 acetylase RimI-like enzyme
LCRVPPQFDHLLKLRNMEKTRIFEVTEFRNDYLDAVNRLLKQLSTHAAAIGKDDLEAIIACGASHLFLLEYGGRIAGMATVCLYRCPTGMKAWIEDLVVDSGSRGHGLGLMLTEHASDFAENLGNVTLMLTSRPSRLIANSMYRSAGFVKRETNVYRKQSGHGVKVK